MKVRESFVTNSSSASYVVNPSLMYNPDYTLEDIARDMLDVMLEEDDDWWNEERINPLKERLENINLKKDAGIRFPSCEYDTHIWFNEGERRIIIHTCNNHPFNTIGYFQDDGYPEDGSDELYRKRNDSQIFYDLEKKEYVIGDEQYIYGPSCSCRSDSSISKFYRSAEKEAYEETKSDTEKLLYGNIICCNCRKLIRIIEETKFYDEVESPELDYHFVSYYTEKPKKKKKRKKVSTMEEDFMNALLE